MKGRAVVALLLLLGLSGCGNQPYSSEEVASNTFFTAFSEKPKHLDPARAYAENEYALIANIYTPPLQYHYRDRPYRLVPLALSQMPQLKRFSAQGQLLREDDGTSKVAWSEYHLHLRHDLRFAPHPAFARDAQGRSRYLDLSPDKLKTIRHLSDFEHHGTRVVTAHDFVYGIKRLARPDVQSPILGLMAQHIVGLKAFAETLQTAHKQRQPLLPAMAANNIAGVWAEDDHHVVIRIEGQYPQFSYWLAMPFFSPMAPEVEQFYSQKHLAENNLSLDTYPVGSGPYFLSYNDPNRRMVLERNPNYFHEPHPWRVNQAMPLIDRYVFSLEKEAPSHWNKFLQGYYDASGISSDNFDHTIVAGSEESDQPDLTPAMKQLGVRLQTAVERSVFYMGFNMLDATVGGYSPQRQKLRQAIAIALNQEEFISIFMNGRGVPAHGPIPPGITGHEWQVPNRFLYTSDNNKPPQKLSLDTARQLLAEAGYPGGRERSSGQPLLLTLDTTGNGLGSQTRSQWLKQQFKPLGIELVIRSTDFNRFQEKLRTGNTQMYYMGWNADYPDPENFLFLLNGAESKVKKGGENTSNYDNPQFNALFEKIRAMSDSEQRQVYLKQAIAIAQQDSPWVWGFYPKNYSLTRSWVSYRLADAMGNDSLKYLAINPAERAAMQRMNNQPALLPLLITASLALALVLGLVWLFHRRNNAQALQALNKDNNHG